MEGSGRGLIEGAIPVFAWRDWNLSQDSQSWGEIWTRNLLNTKQDC
jgi:hypothetical protein